MAHRRVGDIALYRLCHPRTSHPADPAGAQGRPAPALLLAWVPAPLPRRSSLN